MKNILDKLYFGCISPWEYRVNRSVEENNIENKIELEKKYFKETLSEEDYKRLSKLEDLQIEVRVFENVRSFNYGFRLGVRLMCDVFCGEEAENHGNP